MQNSNTCSNNIHPLRNASSTPMVRTIRRTFRFIPMMTNLDPSLSCTRPEKPDLWNCGARRRPIAVQHIPPIRVTCRATCYPDKHESNGNTPSPPVRAGEFPLRFGRGGKRSRNGDATNFSVIDCTEERYLHGCESNHPFPDQTQLLIASIINSDIFDSLFVSS